MSGDVRQTWMKLTVEKAATKSLKTEIGVFEVRPPTDTPVAGSIVLIQEIFGVNAHIRSLAIRYAEAGYVVWAPAYFDHIESGIELAYDSEGIARGRDLVGQLGWDLAVEDTRTAAEELRKRLAALGTPKAKITAIGFCWGGSLAWLAATRLRGVVDGAVSYYGRAVWEFRTEKPHVPVMFHFGEKDSTIPMSNVHDIRMAQPNLPLHVYDADHGFNCDARASFNADAAALAEQRTFEFLRRL